MKATLDRTQLLAAEVFSYSYVNYQNHLGANARFDQSMPNTVEDLERAESESWPLDRLAEKLEIDEPLAEDLMGRLTKAREIVDAENPAEGFRNAVRQVLAQCCKLRGSSSEEIDGLVVQICYRVADLAYTLKSQEEDLSKYSRYLRREPDIEYDEKYLKGEVD